MTKDQRGFRSTVPVQDISEEGLRLTFEDMPGLLNKEDECRIKGPAEGEAFLFHIDGNVQLNGRVSASIILKCHRCLQEYDQKVDVSFFYMFVPGLLTKNSVETALGKEDIETSAFDGSEIHLGEIFREQILLQIPMKNVCMEDCKGICLGCGADLNREKCRCERSSMDSPFDVLRELHVAAE